MAADDAFLFLLLRWQPLSERDLRALTSADRWQPLSERDLRALTSDRWQPLSERGMLNYLMV